MTLLRRLGVDAEFPSEQACWGPADGQHRLLDEAVPVVRNYVEAFAGYDVIVTPSGSCAGSTRP